MQRSIEDGGINILIVEDNAGMVETLRDILLEEGYTIGSAPTIALARERLKEKFFNLVLLDLKLSDGSGLELLKEIKKTNRESMVIILTGYASLESSITALNEGAFTYLQKPLNMDEVKILVEKALKMQELSIENKELINRLKELSLKDVHTELYNYKYLMERLSSELIRARRNVLSLSLAMMDIDYFNSINELYGHKYGDALLKEFARYLMKYVRGMAIVTRYSGEEFIIVLPDTDKDGAVKFAERLSEDIKKHVFDPEGKRVKLKISIGIVSFPQDDICTESGFINLASKALLNAKESGGGAVAVLKTEAAEAIIREGMQEDAEKLKKRIFEMEKDVKQSFLESIYAFAKTIEAKDSYTSEHGEETVSFVTEMGKRLNLSDRDMENLKHAAMLHDLGKIGIPDDILRKNGKLTDEEYAIIKRHPQIGAEIIRPIHFLKDIIPIILYHHERFDGSGYPSGFKGEEIPLSARIMAIADVYQALVSDRPYRKAYSEKEALDIVREGSGTQFDPEIVKVFIDITRPGDSR